MRNLKHDLRGRRIGRWMVYNDAPIMGRGTAWVCLCDCGTVKSVLSQSLIGGFSLSCGCSQREQTARQFTKLPGWSARRRVMCNYKSHARRRKLAWKLPDSEFANSWQHPHAIIADVDHGKFRSLPEESSDTTELTVKKAPSDTFPRTAFRVAEPAIRRSLIVPILSFLHGSGWSTIKQ
jgi:hypothetical protein